MPAKKGFARYLFGEPRTAKNGSKKGSKNGYFGVTKSDKLGVPTPDLSLFGVTKTPFLGSFLDPLFEGSWRGLAIPESPRPDIAGF